ncbi:MAG: glycosyltransferase, partial [Anaerolineae bacterium]|nr:glycosyltransferase [Anaerolineae bacterium]
WGRGGRPLYCSVDPTLYYPQAVEQRWDLGYMGTYSADRQPGLDQLMLEVARQNASLRAVVAGSQYPPGLDWPPNVERIEHLSPAQHNAFYNAQRFTLNITRQDMRQAGFSPSVRLFEAAACGTPIISDAWPGLEHFFRPGQEILVSDGAAGTRFYLETLSEAQRQAIAERARARVLAEHTAAHRAREFEAYVSERQPALAR